MIRAQNGIWNRNPIRAVLLILALACFSLNIHAAKLAGWGTAGVTSNGGKSFSISPGGGDLRVPITNPGGGWQTAGNYGIQNGPTGTTFRLGADGQVFRSMPDGTTIKYPVHAEAPFSVGDLAGAAAGFLSGPLGVACMIACPAIADWMTKGGVRFNPDNGKPEIMQGDSINCSVSSPCYLYRPMNYSVQGGPFQDAQGACLDVLAGMKRQYPDDQFSLTSGPTFFDDASGGYCTFSQMDRNGSGGSGNAVFTRVKVETGSTQGGEQRWSIASEPQIKDRLIGTHPNIGTLKELLDKGADVPMPGAKDSTRPGSETVVTGPSSIAGPKKETTNADGTRTEIKTTYNFQTAGNTVTNTTNNVTTTIYNTDNSVRSVTNTSETPVDDTVPDEDKEKEDACKENPDRLGCMDQDVPELEIPRSEKKIEFNVEEPFGGGACPSDVIGNFQSAPGLSGVKLLDWQSFCSMALPLRAIVMALASIMAFFIVMPGGRVE